MASEDQEQFEDYLKLEQYLEDLRAGHATFPKDMTPSQWHVYQMAALFHSASPEVTTPRPEFVAQLKARLLASEEESQEPEQPLLEDVPLFETAPSSHQMLVEEETAKIETVQPSTVSPQKTAKKAKFVSRRALLTGGTAIAASLVVGAGIDRVAVRSTSSAGADTTPPSGSDQYTKTPIVGDVPTTWHFVTTLARLDEGAVRFVSDAVIGYVVRGEDDPYEGGEVIAMSAACTHMGCIVKWQDADHQFHCPCHDGIFSEYGEPVGKTSHPLYLTSLPRLETKVEDGKVYVKVPASNV